MAKTLAESGVASEAEHGFQRVSSSESYGFNCYEGSFDLIYKDNDVMQ